MSRQRTLGWFTENLPFKMPQEHLLELLRQRASAAKPEARDQMPEVRYGARV